MEIELTAKKKIKVEIVQEDDCIHICHGDKKLVKISTEIGTSDYLLFEITDESQHPQEQVISYCLKL